MPGISQPKLLVAKLLRLDSEIEAYRTKRRSTVDQESMAVGWGIVIAGDAARNPAWSRMKTSPMEEDWNFKTLRAKYRKKWCFFVCAQYSVHWKKSVVHFGMPWIRA